MGFSSDLLLLLRSVSQAVIALSDEAKEELAGSHGFTLGPMSGFMVRRP